MSELLTAPAPAVARTPRLGAAIAGLGVALPSRVVTTTQIASRLGVDPAWIVQRTGIRQRRVCSPGEGLTDLAARAARAALDDARVHPASVDLVLVATTTADDVTPGAAPLVAFDIGATGAAAMDVAAACTGFLSGLSLAAAAIESGRARTVVLVGADVFHGFCDPEDRATAALFGDGAGAVVLQAGSAALGPVVLRADAQRDLLYIDREEQIVRMDGPEVFRHAVDRMTEATLEALADAGLSLDDVDCFAYHQANARITAAVGRRLGVDADRVVDCIEDCGNTSAASLPLALAHARREGLLAPGATVLLGAFGAGFTWGATTLTWGDV